MVTAAADPRRTKIVGRRPCDAATRNGGTPTRRSRWGAVECSIGESVVRRDANQPAVVIGHVIHDWLDGAQIRVDRFQVFVGRVSIRRPRHRRIDRARHAHVPAGANRLHEHLFRPDAETRVLLRRQIERVAHAPGSAERGVRGESRPEIRFGRLSPSGNGPICSGWPDRNRVMSGSGPCGPIFHGVWQSLQPMIFTRYSPRCTRLA